ncbi:MAG: flagellar hook-length control protein FliK [Marinobacter sp.]|nr:flagellar hook-length control protein FliK [Marinobacter sp.]
MTQTVLPQTPAPGMQNDAGLSKTGSGRDSSASESRYDSISRAEQKRLDRQQSERNDKARQADAQNTRKEDSTQPANPAQAGRTSDESGKSGKTAKKGEDSVAEKGAGNKNAETAEMETVTTPLTFAELQALLQPATGSAATNPALAQGAELFAGLIGEKPGQAGAGGLMGGLSFTDALLSGAGKKAGAIDPSSLLSGTRFEATMDLASQHRASSTGKLAAEAQVPLRSYTTSVDVPVNHAQWGDKLMGKLSWLTAKNLSVAEIHLTPPDMGPMEVRVRVQNDQANITVHAANPVVRDQLELNSHRLRDMLGEQGLALAQFDVSSNSQNQSGEQSEGEGSSSGAGTVLSGAENADTEMQAGNLDLSWTGAVDIFA